MADPPRLPPGEDDSSQAVVATIDGATYRLGIDLNQTITNISLMNPEAAAAMIKTSENQFAIPAQEATKQGRQLTARRAVEGAVLVVGLITMGIVPAVMWPAAIMVALVIGGVEGLPIVERLLAAKRQLTDRPAPPKG